MRPKNILFILAAVAVLVFAFKLSTHAQEMGWDEDEEPQRLEEQQIDEEEQGGQDMTEATGVPTPARETKGEKQLTEWEGISTGYLSRSYVIRQENLAGKWQDADIFPAGPKWMPVDAATYESSLKSGTVDARLKGTVYGPYYENMLRICRTAPSAADVHIKSPDSSPQWKTGQRMQRPYTLYRQLQFECLVKAR